MIKATHAAGDTVEFKKEVVLTVSGGERIGDFRC